MGAIIGLQIEVHSAVQKKLIAWHRAAPHSIPVLVSIESTEFRSYPTIESNTIHHGQLPQSHRWIAAGSP